MRDGRLYNSREPAGEGRVFAGVDVTTPVAGWYRGRLRSGAVRGGIRLFYGPPSDPVTGEILDRSWRWQSHFNGEPCDFEDVWPVCAGSPITEAEYLEYITRSLWAKESAPNSAYADPRKRVDPLSAATPIPF